MLVGTALPTFEPANVVTRVPYDFYAGTLGTIPSGVNVTITNPSLLALDFTVTAPGGSNPLFPSGWTDNVPYFKLNATSGSIPSGGSAILIVSVNAACLIDTTCIPYSNAVPTWDAWAVTFPAINYTYYLIATLGLTGPSSAPPIPSWGAPPSLSLSHGFFGLARPASPRPATASSHPCTNSVLEGKITSLPLTGVRTVIGQPTPLEVTAFDNCGNSFNSGSVLASFSTGEPPVSLAPMGGGQWSATWVPSVASSTAVITLQGISQDGLQGGGTLPVAVTSSTTPVVTPGGVINAASYAPVIAPGAFISIFGQNMASTTAVESTTTYPTSLNGTQVFLGGKAMPLFFTASKQIDAIVPFDIAPGSLPQLVVQNGNALSTPVNVPVGTASPGVFTQDQSGSGPGAILGLPAGSAVATLNTASNPSKAGDALAIYCTGLGPVSPAVTAGTPASLTDLSRTVNTVTATVGGRNADVIFAGLAPGYVGLYQVNVIVPSGIAPSNSVPVVLSVAGSSSAPVTVALK